MNWLPVLEIISKVIEKITERMRQNDRDKLENDPVDWFADHFDGVRDNTETDKTDDIPDQK